MRRRVALGLLLTVSVCSPAAAAEWATKMFKTTKHDFGAVARGAKAEFEFVLENIYLEDVHIASVRSSCGCTSPRIKQAWLKTYEKGAIVAKLNTGSFRGRKGATITVTFDKPLYATVQLHVTSYIRSDVVLTPGQVELGSVDQGSPAEKKITVTYAGRSDWRILDVKSANPYLSGKVVETGRGGGRVAYDLSVRLDDHAPPGYIRDQLILVTNDYRSTQLPVPVEGLVQPGITVSPASLFLGVVHPGQKVTKQLVVRSKKPFRITSVSCDDDCFEFEAPAGDSPKSLHLIPVTFVAGETPGKVLKTIRIETDLGETPPDLPAYAVISP